MAHCTEDDFKSRRRLHAPLVLASNQFIGKNGKVCGVEVEEVEWIPAQDGGRPTMKPTGKKEVIDTDMVLLAMGFLKPEQPEFPENVFVAGDAARGASLWCMHWRTDGEWQRE